MKMCSGLIAEHLRLAPRRLELLALAEIGGEGDDFAAVGRLQPLEDDRSVEAARIGEHDALGGDLRLGHQVSLGDNGSNGGCERRQVAGPAASWPGLTRPSMQVALGFCGRARGKKLAPARVRGPYRRTRAARNPSGPALRPQQAAGDEDHQQRDQPAEQHVGEKMAAERQPQHARRRRRKPARPPPPGRATAAARRAPARPSRSPTPPRPKRTSS